MSVMSIECNSRQSPRYVGPFNPLVPVGDVEVLASHHNRAVKIQRQEFEDGWTYELTVERGQPFYSIFETQNLIPRDGVWLNLFNPHDIGSMDTESLYLTVWVSKKGTP